MILPARMHEVQTWTRLGEPFTRARTFWMFGFQRRLVRRCEWLSRIPKEGCLPQMSQVAAMARASSEWFSGRGPRLASSPMEALRRLRPADLASVMRVYLDLLRSHQESINRLNVYPVPDGDTGTNMALTIESVVAELDKTGADGQSLTQVCGAIAHGSLMGARGNSGVILSQLLRGISSVLGQQDDPAVPAQTGGPAQPGGPEPDAHATVLADALVAASDAARKAVSAACRGDDLDGRPRGRGRGKARGQLRGDSRRGRRAGAKRGCERALPGHPSNCPSSPGPGSSTLAEVATCCCSTPS